MVSGRGILHHRQYGQYCKDLQRTNWYAEAIQYFKLRLTASRSDRTSNRRAQSLCARCRVGSPQRVRGNSVIGSIGPHICSQDQRWAIHAVPARQIYQDGSTGAADILQQSSPTRYWDPSTVCRRCAIACRGIASTFDSRNTDCSSFADESTRSEPQPSVIVWLFAINSKICVTSSVVPFASRKTDGVISQPVLQPGRQECQYLCK